MQDFATRAHNHNYRLDPVVRSLLDTDFYKLLMLNFIRMWFPNTQVTFSLINRTKSVRLADEIPEAELRAQLDHVRELRFTRSELVWLNGNSFYGQTGIFPPEFIAWLETLRLPEYDLSKRDGQWVLHFSGSWPEVTLWEIYALAIVSELRSRAAMRKMSRFELDIFYARAKTRIWDKIGMLRDAKLQSSIADFGTRRRHSFLWQEWVVLAMAEELAGPFAGTSNAYLAMKHNLEAIGTNAHELPMVMAALAEQHGDEALQQSQYMVLRYWERTYGGNLKVALPDTFGTTQFLEGAPDWVADWGLRYDSKDPFEAGEEGIAFWLAHGRDPRERLSLFSDGLDADLIIRLDREFSSRTRTAFGLGTLGTNDMRGCHPRGLADLDPISLVCKVTDANGIPTVKLSDNTSKATGPKDSVDRYIATFGSEGRGSAATIV